MVQPPALLGVADILLRKREACAVVVGGERFAGWRELKGRVQRLEEQGKAGAAASGNGRCIYGEADARFLGALLAQGVARSECGGRSGPAEASTASCHEYRVCEGGRGRFVAVAAPGTEAVWSAKRAAEAVLKAAPLRAGGRRVPTARRSPADDARGEGDADADADCLDSPPGKAAESDARLPEAKRRRMLPQYLRVRMVTDGTVGVLAVKRAFEAEGVRPRVVGPRRPGSDGGATVECTFDEREEKRVERALAVCKGHGLCSASEVVGADSDGQGRLAGVPASRWGGGNDDDDGRTLFGPPTDGPRCLPDFLSPSEERELRECCSGEGGDGDGGAATVSLVGDLSPAAQLLGRLGAARMREGVDEADRVGSEPTAVQVAFPREGETVALPPAVKGAECLFMLSMGADTVLTARRCGERWQESGGGGGGRSSRVPLERRVCVLLQGARWRCTFGRDARRGAGARKEPQQTAEEDEEETDDEAGRGDSYAVEYDSTVLAVPTGRVTPAAHWVAVFFRERDGGRSGSCVTEGGEESDRSIKNQQSGTQRRESRK